MAIERPNRRLTTILAADAAGYSRLVGADEEGTLERLRAIRKDLIDPVIAAHRGRIVKTTGDGLLVEFRLGCGCGAFGARNAASYRGQQCWPGARQTH